IRQNRNRRLAFDDALRGREFIQQRGLCDAEFHLVMFLACRSRCGHYEVYPQSGLGRGLRCLFLPLSYCTRFSVTNKAHSMLLRCGNRWETMLLFVPPETGIRTKLSITTVTTTRPSLS